MNNTQNSITLTSTEQNQNKETCDMNNFIYFTDARKSMIARSKSLLTDPDNLKLERNQDGHRLRKLFFRDYVVYAILRGADFKKTSHMEDGLNAREELEGMLKAYANSEKHWSLKAIGRYADNAAEMDELKALIDKVLLS